MELLTHCVNSDERRPAGRFNSVLFAALFTLAAVHPTFAKDPSPDSVMIAPHEFQIPGEWLDDPTSDGLSRTSLRGTAPGTDALTVVSLKKGGLYHIWATAKDSDIRPGTRLFKILVDGQPLEKTLGAHGHNGWRWEKAGDVTLAAGKHVLGLRVVETFGRCGNILLTLDDGDPNGWRKSKLLAAFAHPYRVSFHEPSFVNQAAGPAAPAGEPAAQLIGKQVRFGFRQQSSAIEVAVRATDGGAWKTLPLAGAGRLLWISTEKGKIDTAMFSPAWPNSDAADVSFTVQGREYHAKLSRDPFLAGHVESLEGQAVRQVDAQTVEITYRSKTGQTATARWTLDPDANDAKVAITITASSDSFNSLAYLPFPPVADDAVRYDLLPPLYQGRRRPVDPLLIPNSITSHPLALLETTLLGPDAPVCIGIAAEPTAVPFVWPNAQSGTYGFSLLGPDSQWQPTAFAPILGGAGSHLASGEKRTVAFRVFALPGDWKTGLEYSSERIDAVRDYRKPWQVSLSDAAFNMIDLLKDDNASGWNPTLKGFEQIESQDTVSHASPLGVVEAALLTHDEDLYVRRALPTIEFTLSRRNAHFATHLVGSTYIRVADTQITVPSQFFQSAYWQGLYDLLGRGNGWMTDLAAGADQNKSLFGPYKPHWVELMGLYRLKATPELLARIRSEADAWIAQEIDTPLVGSNQDLGFYNLSHYAYWWQLPDLYELTGDRKYLDAAQEAAFGTIGGLWSSPQPSDEMIKIHPGGKFPGIGLLWWKGHEHFRLGYPRTPGDAPEHDVPAWLVANQGLGLEGISSYYMPSIVADNSHIFMSAWAPSLLRMYELTGREIFQTYARNTIISRFGNYPGYYINGFTDLPLDPNYPYKGPDVTSLYYHHIPVQLGFSIEFLVEEAAVRSHGAIHFPWVRQQGYAWFDNRIYGTNAGSVFGDNTAGLWLDRKLAKSASPAINYLTARGHDRFWLVLLNEADNASPASIVIDAPKLGINAAGPATLFTASGESRPVALSDLSTISVPPKGLIAISFPLAAPTSVPAIPALAGGRATVHAGGAWGDVQAFRIRSPFGKDSLYVVLTGHPADGATATLSVQGAAAPLSVGQFPYEFTLYPWPMDKDLSFTLALTTPDGAVVRPPTVILPGTR
jgi:hypothetical protein